jgi:hypothetical protein
MNDIAVLYSRQDNLTEAEKYYDMALKIRREVLGEVSVPREFVRGECCERREMCVSEFNV